MCLVPNLNAELIPLNLIMDYPVKWSKYKVLRDFMQNFYDAVGHDQWHKKFSCTIENDRLMFQTEGTGFSYEWLLHIGASTKRNQEESFAGYFGEGFKIAALCAIRDFKWQVEMASRDWELEVTTANLSADNRNLVSLAYRVRKLPTLRNNTLLRISSFEPHDAAILECARYSFYYKQNPLFGDPIWEGAHAAVFHRSSAPKPDSFPSTFQQSGEGIVFAGFQALGSFRFPLIFALHGFRLDDRDRSTFYMMDVIKVVKQVAAGVSPEAAAALLEVLRSQWNASPREKYDFESWYGIIRKLVFILSRSSECSHHFIEKYPDLLVTEKMNRSDVLHLNRRRQALSWLNRTDHHYRLVQDGFLTLGFPTLEEKCSQHGGFAAVRSPTTDERYRIALMEEAAYQLFPDLFEHTSLPPCKVIETEDAAWAGMANCVPVRHPESNRIGLKIRYHLPYIALKERLFRPTCFGAAFSTYLHERAHQFGGDRSVSFGFALTLILQGLIDNSAAIAAVEQKWITSFPKPLHNHT